MNNIKRYKLFLLFVILFPVLSWSQNYKETIEALIHLGFENVGCTEVKDERIYVLQNSAYRSNGIGISHAVDVIQRTGLPENKNCRVIILNNNVPQISLFYKRNENVEANVDLVRREDWKVSYDLGQSYNAVKNIKKKNRSLFKVDVLIYPQVALMNLVITQIYQVLVDLNPTIEVSLWKGMKLTGQIKIPVYNDGYGYLEDQIHPGHLTLSQRFRFPYNVFGKLTLGYFNADQYGLDVDLVHVFKDERFALLTRFGYTGTAYWERFKLHYDTNMNFTWSVGGSFYWPAYNVQFNLKLEQYLRKDRGVKIEMMRHFRYCTIGFYAMKAKHAKENGGFRFQIALPPYKYKRKGYLPRINTSSNMGLIYNAGNERYYYKQYKAEASDNIMEANSLNPYFIKSEMLNY